MSDLGRLLSEARAAKDLSYADVENATRVRQKYLLALENGDYASLPPSAIARGFLKNYARFLGLDVDQVLHLYGEESGDSARALAAATAGPSRTVDYRPLEVELVAPRSNFSAWRWVVALLVVVALVVAAWYVLNTDFGRNLMKSNLLLALGPQPTATATAGAARPVTGPGATITPPASEMQGTAPPLPGSQLPGNLGQTPTPTSDLLTLPIPTNQPTITPTPTRTATPTPEAVTEISMTVKITQYAWLMVTADGQQVEQGTLDAGQTRSWGAKQRISIRTGNAAGVGLTLNGQDLGPMGNVGQVMERTWVVEQGKVTEAVGTPAATGAAAPAPTATPKPGG